MIKGLWDFSQCVHSFAEAGSEIYDGWYVNIFLQSCTRISFREHVYLVVDENMPYRFKVYRIPDWLMADKRRNTNESRGAIARMNVDVSW